MTAQRLSDEEIRSLLECFGEDECRLLEDLLRRRDSLPPETREAVESALARAAETLPAVARAMSACPLPRGSERFAGRERSVESLIDSLCRDDALLIEFSLPTGALLGRTFVLARVNFLKALEYCLQAGPPELAHLLVPRVREAIDDAILSRLAEELLTGVVSNLRNAGPIRRAAAHRLLNLWQDRVRHPVQDFPSVLLSAWKARRNVRAVYGTLLGSQEVLSLLRAACEERFVSFFTREQVTGDQIETFREFLFGLPFEEIQEVQRYMNDRSQLVITPEEVYRLLRRGAPPRPAGAPTAEEVFLSYRRRSLRAEYRALSAAAGPHKTAEGYLMEAVLAEELRREAREEPPPGGARGVG